MTEQVTEAAGGSSRMSLGSIGWGVAALVTGLAGVELVGLGTRTGISLGILLLVAALGLAAVSVGGRPFGPAVEGPLDLSARLGLGVLGGVLAGLLHGLLTELVGSLGVPALLGVDIDTSLSGAEWLLRALLGGAWGLALGVFYPLVPGDGFVGKGATFSLLPSLYTLFVVYPVLLGVGLLGVDQGLLTFAFVVAGNVAAGLLAAGVVSWGARTELAPVSDPLVG